VRDQVLLDALGGWHFEQDVLGWWPVVHRFLQLHTTLHDGARRGRCPAQPIRSWWLGRASIARSGWGSIGCDVPIGRADY
jgi:hypothetical protein